MGSGGKRMQRHDGANGTGCAWQLAATGGAWYCFPSRYLYLQRAPFQGKWRPTRRVYQLLCYNLRGHITWWDLLSKDKRGVHGNKTTGYM